MSSTLNSASLLRDNLKSYIASISNTKFLTLLVIVIGVLWLVLYYHFLSYYWVDDDLSLLREYSAHELKSVFTGNWEPDNLPGFTKGYRPFSTIFNHFRYSLFKENVILHRVFLLFLMMFLLWIIGWIALQTGLHRTIIAFALLILSSTKTYSGDIVFITDGIQIFEWFLFFSSIALAIKAIHTNNALYVIASLFTSILCIFTKEESSILLVVSPIIVIFSFNPFNLNKKLQLLFIFYYLSIILCVLALIYFRHTFVAGAIEIKPIATALHGFLFTIVWSFSFVGLPIDSNEITKNFHVVAYQYGYPFSDMIWILWIFICNFYIWLFLFHANKKKLFEFSILIFLNFLSSLQGIVCFRTNVLYFSTMSFAFTFSFLVFNNYNYLKSPTCPLDKYKKSLFIFLSVISVIFIIIFSQIRSYYQIQDLNPNSINRVFSMYEWIYGARGEENPTIPTVRKEFIKKKFLEKYSLNKKYPPDQIKKYKEETFKSLNKNRNIKESSNEMFLPRVWFYSA